jgi:hypothetical protein
MKQLEVSTIEKDLAKHISEFLQDLVLIFSNKSDFNFNQIENKLIGMISKDYIRRMDNQDITNLIETISSINNIGFIQSNEVKELAINAHGEGIFEIIENELGLSKYDQVYIIDQVKLTYQSRLILILLSLSKGLFNDNYDVFLSHSSIDSREVLGIKLSLLYDYNKVSYVDWIDHFELNKQRSTQKIIKLFSDLLSDTDNGRIKELEKNLERSSNPSLTDTQITNTILSALNNSNSFLYIDSKNSRHSKWMPYELGYAEAKLSKQLYRIIIKYKRNRKELRKYNSYLSKYEVINELKKIN